jgi:hypothetical protein
MKKKQHRQGEGEGDGIKRGEDEIDATMVLGRRGSSAPFGGE